MAKITMSFGGREVLLGVDFDCQAGEVHALLGENGAGKSTLMKILAGVYLPCSGSITLNGSPVSWTSPWHAQKSGVAMVYQEFGLLPDLSAGENIMINRWPKNASGLIDWRRVHQKAQELLDSVGSGVSASSIVRELTVPQQQHVEIARALASDPLVLIMDEPTSALSGPEISYLFGLINRVKSLGKGIVFISHKLDEVRRIADRVTVLRDGRVVFCGTMDSVTDTDLVELVTGRKVLDKKTTACVCDYERNAEPVLNVENLADGRLLEKISLKVNPNTVTVVVGLVGSGKTELAKALIGARRLLPCSRLVWRGSQIDLKTYTPCKAVSLGIGLLTENRKEEGLLLDHSAKFNVTLCALKSLRSARGLLLNEKREKALVEDLMQKLKVRPPDWGMAARYFSGGNQQKLLFARWLAVDVKLLILDEPTRGVDVGASRYTNSFATWLRMEYPL